MTHARRASSAHALSPGHVDVTRYELMQIDIVWPPIGNNQFPGTMHACTISVLVPSR